MWYEDELFLVFFNCFFFFIGNGIDAENIKKLVPALILNKSLTFLNLGSMCVSKIYLFFD